MNTEAIGSVYGLKDPRTGRFHYVGETKVDPMKRVGMHVSACLGGVRGNGWNGALVDWVKELSAVGMMPIIEVLEEVPFTGDDTKDKRSRWDAEQRWVLKLQNEGHSLFNMKTGVKEGYQFADGVGPTKLRGRKRPELAEKLRGKKLSDDHKKALSDAQFKRWETHRTLSPEEIVMDHEQRQESARKSWETRRSRGTDKVVMSGQARENIRNGQRGKQKSPTHKLALSIGQSKRFIALHPDHDEIDARKKLLAEMEMQLEQMKSELP